LSLTTEITTLRALLAELATRQNTAKATKAFIALLKAYATSSKALASLLLTDNLLQSESADGTFAKQRTAMIEMLAILGERAAIRQPAAIQEEEEEAEEREKTVT
jgi:hypothetical protein